MLATARIFAVYGSSHYYKTNDLIMNVLRYKLLALCLLFVFSCSAQKRKFIFSTYWLPQAQFAGYYVAQDQGFYEEAGLDIEIIHPSAAVNATKLLAEGKADIITLFLVTSVDAVYNGLDMVNIGQFSQHASIMFVSRKESGIETLNDFEGRKIGIWRSGFKETPSAVIQDHGISVEWVPILSSVNLFLVGGIDILTVMWYNEYHQIYLSGIDMQELNTFFMSDYGYDVPEDGLYVLRSTYEKSPEDLGAFTRASLRGWEYAAKNKEYTVNLVVEKMHEANIPTNIPHQRWMLDKVLELQSFENKEAHPTELLKVDFDKAINIIQNTRNVKTSFDYLDFYKPVIPGDRKLPSP